VWTPDGETNIDRPQIGDFGRDVDMPMIRRFLAELAPLLVKVREICQLLGNGKPVSRQTVYLRPSDRPVTGTGTQGGTSRTRS
jgi:hypothetical protein